jgi:hypothetical protein
LAVAGAGAAWHKLCAVGVTQLGHWGGPLNEPVAVDRIRIIGTRLSEAGLGARTAVAGLEPDSNSSHCQ